VPTRVFLSAIALAGVLVSVAMVLIGLPEATPAQSVLLELSSLPLSVAVGAGILMLHLSARAPLGHRSRTVMLVGAAGTAFGLVMMLWAYLLGPRDFVHSGQVLVWLGLLAMLLVMLRRQQRRRFTRFSLLDPDEQDEDEDAPADQDQTPSL
jgi:hypothetical protein